VSFGNYARKVRNRSLPYGRRVSALRSCVQLYRPIGFHATLGFLEEMAGPYEQDEDSLLRALDALAASRAGWHAEMLGYARRRRQAKQHGRRVPPVDELNPNGYPRIWYGAASPAALYALGRWSDDRLLALTASSDDTATTVEKLVAAVLSSGGDLTPEQSQLLDVTVAELQRRIRSDLWHHDHRAWNLLKVARLVRCASDYRSSDVGPAT